MNTMKKRIFSAVLALTVLLSCLLTVGCEKKSDVVEKPLEGYTPSAETTDYVCMNITYTDKEGVVRKENIVVKLDASNAPITVANFQKLVAEKFYDGIIFHRVVEGFMIQGGDPEGTGYGGSSQKIKGEFLANGVNNEISHKRGVISMARSSNSYNSASSQFFIVHEDGNEFLDGQYAAFGEVVYGIETVDGIATTKVDKPGTQSPKPINPVTINAMIFVTPNN